MAVIDGGGKTYTNRVQLASNNTYQNYNFTGSGGFTGVGNFSNIIIKDCKWSKLTYMAIELNSWDKSGQTSGLEVVNCEVSGFAAGSQYLFYLKNVSNLNFHHTKITSGANGSDHNGIVYLHNCNGEVHNLFFDTYYGNAVRIWPMSGKTKVYDIIALSSYKYSALEVNGNYSGPGTVEITNCTFGKMGFNNSYPATGLTLYDLKGTTVSYTNCWVFSCNIAKAFSNEGGAPSPTTGTKYEPNQSAFFPSGVITLPNGKNWDGDTSVPPPKPNELPVVNAGKDIVVQLPTNSVTIDATASDVEGAVTYLWEKVSGSGIITNPTQQDPSVVNLTEGESEFKVTVTDSAGAKVTDNVKVTTLKAEPPATGIITSIKTTFVKDGKEEVVTVY